MRLGFAFRGPPPRVVGFVFAVVETHCMRLASALVWVDFKLNQRQEKAETHAMRLYLCQREME